MVAETLFTLVMAASAIENEGKAAAIKDEEKGLCSSATCPKTALCGN